MRGAIHALAVTLLLTACATSPYVDSSSPSITALTRDYQGSWEVAWAPPRDEASAAAAALAQAGLWMPFPTATPGETLGMEVTVASSAPGGRPSADVALRRPDQSLYLSLQTGPARSGGICSAHQGDGWRPVDVRGVDGCASEGPVFAIEWTEAGQDFHAEFTGDIEVGVIAAWLATWEPSGE